MGVGARGVLAPDVRYSQHLRPQSFLGGHVGGRACCLIVYTHRLRGVRASISPLIPLRVSDPDAPSCSLPMNA